MNALTRCANALGWEVPTVINPKYKEWEDSKVVTPIHPDFQQALKVNVFRCMSEGISGLSKALFKDSMPFNKELIEEEFEEKLMDGIPLNSKISNKIFIQPELVVLAKPFYKDKDGVVKPAELSLDEVNYTYGKMYAHLKDVSSEPKQMALDEVSLQEQIQQIIRNECYVHYQWQDYFVTGQDDAALKIVGLLKNNKVIL